MMLLYKYACYSFSYDLSEITVITKSQIKFK